MASRARPWPMAPDLGRSRRETSPQPRPASSTPGQAPPEDRRMLATLLDNLPGMAYRCRNDRVWTMEFVSEGSRAITGYAPADLVANQVVAFGDLILAEDREDVWQRVQAALAGRTAFEITYRI